MSTGFDLTPFSDHVRLVMKPGFAARELPAAIDMLARACRAAQVARALFHGMDVEPGKYLGLADGLARLDGVAQRLALATSSLDVLEVYRFAQAAAIKRGLVVQTFWNEADALGWLARGD